MSGELLSSEDRRQSVLRKRVAKSFQKVRLGSAEDGGEVGGEVIGHLAELGEDEDLFLTGGNFFAELAEAVELATVFGRVFIIS